MDQSFDHRDIMSKSRPYSFVPTTHEDAFRVQLPSLSYEYPRRRATHQSPLKRIMHLKHRNTLLLVIFLILLFIAVVATGVLCFKQDVKEANVHSSFTDDINVNVETSTEFFNPNSTSPFIANAVISLTDFNPTGVISYSLIWGTAPNGINAPANGTPTDELPWVCFGITDYVHSLYSFFSAKAPPSSNKWSQYNMNATSSGFLFHYPFDVYTAHLYIEVAAELDPTLTCANASGVWSVAIPFQAFVGQNLEGFTATFDLERMDPRLAWNTDVNFFTLTLTIKRDEVVKFFAVATFIVTWLLTLGVVIGSAQVVLYQRLKARFEIIGAGTALLFALPQIRSSLPGIPLTPTLSDTVGYYWMIALLGLSTFALICHSIWRLRADRYEKRHPKKSSPPQFKELEEEEDDMISEREKERLD